MTLYYVGYVCVFLGCAAVGTLFGHYIARALGVSFAS